MKNILSYDEFIFESSYSTKSKIFIQQNTLWVAHKPNSGTTTQIKGDPDKFRGFWSTDSMDSDHYDFNAKEIEDWSQWNKPDAVGKNYKLFKIPAWWGYRDREDLTIWGGDIKPEYYVWLAVAKMGNGKSLVHLFKTKQEAIAFLK